MEAYLPVRCLPEDDETLPSFALRLASANGYDRVGWLLATAKLPRSFASHECDLGRLAELSGASVGSINAMAIWPARGRPGYARFGAHEISHSAVAYGRPRLCLACVRELQFVRRFWQLRPIVACPVHRVNLIDGCPVCDRPFDLAKSRYECRCRWSIQDDEPVQHADSRMLAVAEIVEELIAGAGLPSGTAPLTSLDCALRLLWLAATSEAATGDWRSLEMSKPRVRDLAPLLVTASPILLDWPACMHEWLASRKRAQDKRTGADAEFGPWLGRLSRVLHCNGCEGIADEVRRWLADHWGKGTLKRASFLALSRSEHAIMSAKEVANTLGVSPSSVTRLVRVGELEGELRSMGTRTTLRVYRHSVERWMADSVADHDAATTAEIIGAPVSTIHTLRRHGVLASRMRSIGGRRENRFSDEAIAAFSASLAAKSPPLPRGMGALVRLRNLPGRRQANLGLTLVSILNGDIPCWQDASADGESILDRLFVPLSHVASRRPDRAESLSVREAAAFLGLNVRMMPALARAGCVHALTGTNRAGYGLVKRSIDARSIRCFPRIYIMTQEIATMCGTNTRNALNLLKAAGLKPVVESNSHKGISAVWRRSDVAGILIAGGMQSSRNPTCRRK